jgi:hypothetical protein
VTVQRAPSRSKLAQGPTQKNLKAWVAACGGFLETWPATLLQPRFGSTCGCRRVNGLRFPEDLGFFRRTYDEARL